MAGLFLPVTVSADRNYDPFQLYTGTIAAADVTTPMVTADYQSAYMFVTTTGFATQSLTFELWIYSPVTDGLILLQAFPPGTVAAITTDTTTHFYIGRAAVEQLSSIAEQVEFPLPQKWALKLITADDDEVVVTIEIAPVSNY